MDKAKRLGSTDKAMQLAHRSKRDGAPGNTDPSATISRTASIEVLPFLFSTDLPGVLPVTNNWPMPYLKKSCWLTGRPSRRRARTSGQDLGPQPLRTGGGAKITFDSPFSQQLSAVVIFHGYETSSSILRILRVEEHSQLDNKGVSGAKIGTAQDCLYHLGNVGSVGKLHRHKEIKIGTEVIEIQREPFRAESKGFPQRPAEVVPNILRSLRGVQDCGKRSHPSFSPFNYFCALSLTTKIGKLRELHLPRSSTLPSKIGKLRELHLPRSSTLPPFYRKNSNPKDGTSPKEITIQSAFQIWS
ncbi:LOW QUALITY PROTEIN: hypothetical protein Cgig2_016766 [Carnegiea gigantea]|uniref:Uncharacterized protein n=1 Tax=Carnegiea gigantea TaxID=171969 RepID=A0A9Q1H061_9CARY|nr:LOW QUALITY PROTEIN: hypothetical protein Cgig2_016766 [Carnegiea gigantea]